MLSCAKVHPARAASTAVDSVLFNIIISIIVIINKSSKCDFDSSNISEAAVINVFIINNRSHDFLYMKGVACSDKPIENYHPTLQFPSALWSYIVTFLRN